MSSSAAGQPTPIRLGHPVGVPAGDYLLRLVAVSSATRVGGVVTQYLGGTGPWYRVADFHATPTPVNVSAEVRVAGPSDTLGVVGFFGTITATSATLTPATWASLARGPDITQPGGSKVTWHGVNSNDMWPIPGTVVALHTSTRANIVRVPVYEERWLPFFKAEYQPGYRQHVIDTVNAVTGAGMTAIIDLTSAGHDDPAFNLGYAGDGQLGPDQHSLTFWQDAAQLWANNPRVVFELFNEPRLNASDPEPNGLTGAQVWRNGGTLSFGTNTWVAPGMQQLTDTIRGVGASNLILIDGTSWAGDLRPVERDPIDGTNLVYAFHVYNADPINPSAVPPSLETNVAPLMDPNSYRYATLATEFGTTLQDGSGSALGSAYLTAAIDWISSHGAGWLVWGWYPRAADQFGLLQWLPLTFTTRSQAVANRM